MHCKHVFFVLTVVALASVKVNESNKIEINSKISKARMHVSIS